MVVIGIDPGLTGAIAVLEDGCVADILDMPLEPTSNGKGRQVDAKELHTFLSSWKTPTLSAWRTPMHVPRLLVLIEKVRAMPANVGGKRRKMGAQSMFNFGEGAGVVRAAAALSHVAYRYVEASVWKRRAGLLGKEKDAARTLAKQLFPDAACRLTRKKDIGRADAILIARFGTNAEHLEPTDDIPSDLF